MFSSQPLPMKFIKKKKKKKKEQSKKERKKTMLKGLCSITTYHINTTNDINVTYVVVLTANNIPLLWRSTLWYERICLDMLFRWRGLQKFFFEAYLVLDLCRKEAWLKKSYQIQTTLKKNGHENINQSMSQCWTYHRFIQFTSPFVLFGKLCFYFSS